MEPHITWKRVIISVLVVVLVTGVWSSFADFFPVRRLLGYEAAVVYSLLTLGLALPALIAWRRSRSFSTTAGDSGLPAWMRISIVGLILMPCLGYAMLNLLARGMPWAYTSLVGEQSRIRTVMTIHYESGRRKCNYRATGSLRNFANAGICVSRSEFLAYRDKRVIVLLTGKSSQWGFALQQTEVEGLAIPVH